MFVWLVGSFDRSIIRVRSSCVERKKQRARMVITYLCRCGRCALTRRRARRRTDVLLIFARRLVGGTLGYRRSSFRRCARRRRSVFSSVSFPLCFRACTHRFAPARLFVPFVRLSRARFFTSVERWKTRPINLWDGNEWMPS